ncbi:MAG: tetratricopeptide repeat protein [Planctomycetota bacterium]
MLPSRSLPRPSLSVLLLLLLAGCGGGSSSAPLPPRLTAVAGASADVVQQVDTAYARIEAEPAKVENRLALAAIYEAANQTDLALETYEQIAGMSSEEARVWYHIGRLRAAAQDAEGALAALAEAEKRQGGYPPLFWRRGLLELEREDLEAAERSFRRAAELAPQDPSGPTGLAEVALRRDDVASALKILEELHARLPAERTIGNRLRDALRRAGRGEEAEALVVPETGPRLVYRNDPWMAELSRLRPLALPEILKVAEARLRAADPQGALQVLGPALEKDPGDVSLITRATDAFVQMKQYDAALGMLEPAIQHDPENFRLLYCRGVVLHYKSQAVGDRRLLEEAERMLAKGVELAPAAGDGRLALARVQADLGRLEEALASVGRAIELGQRNPLSVMLRGRVLLNMRRLDEAIATFTEARRDWPEEVAPIAYLAAALTESGRFPEARATLEEVVARQPDHPMIERIRQRMAVLEASGEGNVAPPGGEVPGEGQGDR